jgi:hypothetical protein
MRNEIIVLREFKFPIPSGTVTLMVTFPLTEEDFESLIAIIHTIKSGLLQTPKNQQTTKP